MSERSSFVTEYLYCNQCFEALKKVLKETEQRIELIPTKSKIPIITGFIYPTGSGEEYIIFDVWLKDEITAVICHPVRIALITDSRGEKIYRFRPQKKTKPRKKIIVDTSEPAKVIEPVELPENMKKEFEKLPGINNK